MVLVSDWVLLLAVAMAFGGIFGIFKFYKREGLFWLIWLIFAIVSFTASGISGEINSNPYYGSLQNFIWSTAIVLIGFYIGQSTVYKFLDERKTEKISKKVKK